MIAGIVYVLYNIYKISLVNHSAYPLPFYDTASNRVFIPPRPKTLLTESLDLMAKLFVLPLKSSS